MKKVFFKGYWYRAADNNALIKKIQKERPSISKSIIEILVNEKSEEYEDKEKKKSVSFSQLVAGASAIVNVAKGSTVSQLEINRRAGICSSCVIENNPGLVPVGDCRACGFARRLSSWINKVKKDFGSGFIIPNGLEDKGCGACNCALAVMLPSKITAFDYEKDNQEARPNHCWVKKTSNNHISA